MQDQQRDATAPDPTIPNFIIGLYRDFTFIILHAYLPIADITLSIHKIGKHWHGSLFRL
jgi:hypothetical protein